MFPLIALCLSLILAGPTDEPNPNSPHLGTYHAARDAAGRDPDAHVKLALWCEANGLTAERLHHLALASLTDPNHAVARALLGLVADGASWRSPDAITQRFQTDPERVAKHTEYTERRAKAEMTAESQWRLATWCEQNGLEAEAKAHFTAVTRLDPKRVAAWKRLGFKKHNGLWMTEAQIAATKTDAAAQKEADRHWKPVLEQLKRDLARSDRALAAEIRLSEIEDPRAVPMILTAFASGSESDQQRATQILGQIDSPDASRALAILAITSPSAEVRRAAIETLKYRDLREFADLLVGLVRTPMRYEVRPVAGPGSQGVLFVEGEEFNVRRLYQAPAPPPVVSIDPFESMVWDHFGQPVLATTNPSLTGVPPGRARFEPTPSTIDWGALARQITANPASAPEALRPALEEAAESHRNFANYFNQFVGGRHQVLVPDPARGGFRVGSINPINPWRTAVLQNNLIEAQRANLSAQARLEHDVQAIDAQNQAIRDLNARVLPVLQTVSKESFDEDRSSWMAWWNDQRGSATFQRASTESKPTFLQLAPTYRPSFRAFMSCFGAGTLVHTIEGRKPIEAIEYGDQVLAQDVRAGKLDYQPVTAVYHNPPSKTFVVHLGGESITSSEFHRFWKAGQGWVMARDLKPGDTIRTLGKLARVETIEDGEVQPVYNLDVAEARSFFVGEQGILVHDNTLPSPVLEPFDAAPDLAALTESKRGN